MSLKNNKLETKKSLLRKLKELEVQKKKLHDYVLKKDEEQDELKKKIINLNNLINSSQIQELGKGSSIANSKIFELSKKNRQLTAELEIIKSKLDKTNISYTKLQNDFENYKNEFKLTQDSTKNEFCCESRKNLEALQDKLNVTKNKLLEVQNNNIKLKNDFKLAQKCIQQEIGENFNLSVLASSDSSWRGRSQKILALQSKITELKEKLKENSGVMKSPDLLIIKNGLRISKSELYSNSNRKIDVEELRTNLAELKLINEAQKQKIFSLKSRNKTLVDEILSYKLKAMNLVEKTNNTDNSIEALNEELNVQKYSYENKINSLNKEISDLKSVLSSKNQAYLKLEEDVKTLKCIIDNKEKQIDKLNKLNIDLENDIKSVCGDFLFSCRDLKKDEYIGILDAMESEKSGLTKRNQMLLVRLEEERKKVNDLNEQVLKLKTKSFSQEIKIKELIKEQNFHLDKSSKNRKITKLTQSFTNFKIPTIIFENPSTSSESKETVQKHPTTAASAYVQMETFENINLKNELEVAEEKILFLEDKISHLTKEKEADLKLFNEMIENSKTTLLDIIGQNRNQVSNTSLIPQLKEKAFQIENL